MLLGCLLHVRSTVFHNCTTSTYSGSRRVLVFFNKNYGQSLRSKTTTGSAGSVPVPKTGKKSDFLRLLSLARPEAYRIAGAMGLLVISSGVTMSVPFAFGKVIDIIYSMDQVKTMAEQKAEIRERLNFVCMVLAGVFAVGAGCNFGRVYLTRVAGQNITANLRNKVYSSIVQQEVAFFDKTKTGELINRLSADSQLVSQTVTQQVSDGLRSSFMTLAGVGMMFYMSPQLAFVGLGIVPPVALWAVYMGKKVKSASKNVQDSLASATEIAEEKISNIRTVRIFAKEREEINAYKQRMDKVIQASVKEALIQAKFFGMTGLSGNVIILTVLYYGGSLVTDDLITVGNLTSFIMYSAYVGIGLSGISTFHAEMMKGLGASSRLWELVDKQPSVPLEGGLIPSKGCKGDIRFSNLHFSFPSRPNSKILNALELHIPANTIVAVVGPSGSGKSTLASLLLRLYEPQEGHIFLDDKNIQDLDPSWLRRYIGTVSQEPILFNTSIKENILYGVEDASTVSDLDVEAAAREANAHDFISNFTEGYETMVGERGIMLSGGQKQRIAIARAILKNPSILLLDEATSALDAISEQEVKIALDKIMKGRSVITIAHRLSTIKNANLIAVLDRGQVAELGSFEELMKNNGTFRSLVEQQMKGFK
uniref:ATP-binding cassette sub-family B member 10, mitochondrial n=1 Tax=Eurytemora affinis TaxID=88015 RepID=A0A8B0MFR4_EURAF|nr:ABCB10 [Eurytemora affinis]